MSVQFTYVLYTIERLVIVCVPVCVCECATRYTQCCAYWMHLPRCTLNELWLLMNTVANWREREKKKFNDNSQNWPSPHRCYYTWVPFVFFSFISFLHSYFFFCSIHSFLVHFFFFSLRSFRTAYQNGKFNWKNK